MCNLFKVVLFGVFFVMFFVGFNVEIYQYGDMNVVSDVLVQQVIKGIGIVKEIDMNSKKIIILYEVILVVGWFVMIMCFIFVNVDDVINVLKIGNYVDFLFIQQGNIFLFKSINVM